jgi:hypothetical protein
MILTARVQRGSSETARCASTGIVPATPAPFSLLLNDDCRAAGTHHQHGTVGADRFIIEINADNGIGAQMLSMFLHFTQRNIFALAQLGFIPSRSATTISRTEAKKSRKIFAPRMACLDTNPTYLTAFFPSSHQLQATAKSFAVFPDRTQAHQSIHIPIIFFEVTSYF